jgi:hypothetical protein
LWQLFPARFRLIPGRSTASQKNFRFGKFPLKDHGGQHVEATPATTTASK